MALPRAGLVEPANARGQGYGAAFGDFYVRLATDPETPLRIYTKDSLAQRQDQKGSVHENVLDLGYAYARDNLTGGEGLDYWPRTIGEVENEQDPIRFWDSADLDIRRPKSGTPYGIRLNQEFRAYDDITSPVAAVAATGAVYVAAGAVVNTLTDWEAAPAITQTLDSPIVQLSGIASGFIIAVTVAGDIWAKGELATAFIKLDLTTATPAAVTPGFVNAAWVVKNRIVAYTGDLANPTAKAVWEINPSFAGTPGTPTVLGIVATKIQDTNAVLNVVVDAGHAIVGAFDDGSLRSYVPQSDSAGDAPILTVRGQASMPGGENPFMLAWNAGKLAIFTTERGSAADDDADTRMYSGEVLDERFDFVPGNFQALRVWEDSGDPITGVKPPWNNTPVSTRDELYFTVEETPDEHFLWRWDLVTNGLFRETEDPWAGAAALTMYENEVAVGVGTELLVESEELFQEDGYLITPNVNFGLSTSIAWTSFVVEASGLEAAGTKVELYRTSVPEAILDKDHSAWVLVTSLTDPIQSGREISLINVLASSQSLMIKLYASEDQEATPVLTKFAVRGFPKHRDWIADIPVNVSDYVEVPGRMQTHVPELGDELYAALVAFQGAAMEVLIFNPPTVIRGVIDGLETPRVITTPRGTQQKLCMVRVRGSLQSGVGVAGGGTSGDGGVGLGLLGVSITGLGGD